MSKHPDFWNEMAASCRLLGGLFYLSPKETALAPFFAQLEKSALCAMWPFGQERELEAIDRLLRENLDMTHLTQAYQALFIGPHPFHAPPWGSVYLSEDACLYGDSTRALRTFLAKQGWLPTLRQEEPEDHVGLMFWVLAQAATEGDARTEAICQFIHEHFLPWSARYFAALDRPESAAFYRGLGRLAHLTLAELASEFSTELATKSTEFTQFCDVKSV